MYVTKNNPWQNVSHLILLFKQIVLFFISEQQSVEVQEKEQPEMTSIKPAPVN